MLSIEYRRVTQAGKVTFLERCATIIHVVLVMWQTKNTRVTYRTTFNSFFCPRRGWDLCFPRPRSASHTLNTNYTLYVALGVTESHPACRGYGLWLSHTRVSMVAVDLGLRLTSQSDGTWWNMGRINVTITVVIVMIDSRVNIRKFSQMIPPPPLLSHQYMLL